MKLKGSPFAWVSFAMIVGVMGTALISPLYALYKTQWQLQASDISLVYVIYMAGALCGLLFLGRMPDRIGFMRVMQWGLALTLVGTALCMLATGMGLLSTGRFIVGVASSMLTTSSLAGMALLAPPGKAHQTATLSGFLMALGFGLGPLIGGLFGQWAPSPLVTSYLPTLLLVAMGLAAMTRLHLPDHAQPAAAAALHWTEFLPRLTGPSPADRGAFALVTCLPLLGFAVFGLYAAMSPLFLDQLIPWHGPIVAGSAIAAILFSSATVQVLSARLPTHRCGALGLLALAASNALLILNLWQSSAALFFLGVVLTAVGHGMCMLSGITMVGRIAQPGQRSGLLASYLVVGYIGSMVPMLGIGWIADHWGMDTAVSLFCAVVVIVASVVSLLYGRHRRMRAS